VLARPACVDCRGGQKRAARVAAADSYAGDSRDRQTCSRLVSAEQCSAAAGCGADGVACVPGAVLGFRGGWRAGVLGAIFSAPHIPRRG
jgi:hypothetical protein